MERGIQIVARTGFAPEDELAAIRRLLPWHPDALVLARPARAPDTAEAPGSRGVARIEAMNLPARPIDMAAGFRHRVADEIAAEWRPSGDAEPKAEVPASVDARVDVEVSRTRRSGDGAKVASICEGIRAD